MSPFSGISILWRKIWSVLGSVPLWVKIMGIVVFPLFVVGTAVVLYIRSETLRYLMTHQHTEVIAGLYPILTEQAIMALIITFMLGLLLALGLNNILMRQLNQLLATIGQVEKGDLSARVKVWAADEIGRLQRSFNSMTAQLEQSHNDLYFQNRELTAINKVTEAVAMGRQVDVVIEIALNNVVSLMNADLGTIYLLEDENTFVLKASYGALSPELQAAMACRDKDTSPMRRMLSTGRAVELENLRNAVELPPKIAELAARDGFTSWACAPIKVQGKIIGAFNLSARDKRIYNPKELELLELIGNVIGVSISNAGLIEDLTHKEVELRRALRRAVELQEDERNRLARELHDEAGQALTAILIRLKALQEEKDIETIIDRLDGLRYLTSQTLEELHRLSMDLRPSALDNLGILPALRWYTRQAADTSGLSIHFSGPEKLERLPSETEVVLYRVAQEGINNAIRHSRARQIEVTLELGRQSIWLAVTDDGQGFDPASQDRGLGLLGVRERVELLKGTCGVETNPGAGTRLWIELPLADGHEHGA